MKKEIFPILIIIFVVNTAHAATQISIRPFCGASASLMSVFTVIEGTTIRKGEKTEKDRFVFKATCDLTLSTCSLATVNLKNLEVGQPLNMLDVVATEAKVTSLGKNVYEIHSGLASVYTIDLTKKTVTNQMSLPDFGGAKAQESLGVGRCD
jgi:hypothetical protein